MAEKKSLTKIPNVLSIAGSDPSGGAGVQADLKTFSALGCYGLAALTALTAQNTQGVRAVHMVPPVFLRDQLDALFDDMRIDAVKIGMAGTAQSISVISDTIKKYAPSYIVVDPVMVATSGDVLLPDDAMQALQEELIPLASVITPNIPEAEILAGGKLDEDFGNDLNVMASRLGQMYDVAVILKGGHSQGQQATDILCFADGQCLEFSAPRIETKNTHGTGCTLSSALAAYLALGVPLSEALAQAKEYLTGALMHSSEIDAGQGHGPVHHFYKLWAKE